MKAGGDTLLGFEDDCYKRSVLQDYYWFGEDAPVRIDLTPVWQAANRVAIPAGRMSLALGPDAGSFFDGPGLVDVQFHLNSGRLVVTGASYKPEAQFKWGRGCR